MEPDVDIMICIPTDIDNIWNAETEGNHFSPNTINVISWAENQRNTDNGKPIKASKRMIFSYEVAKWSKSCW